MFPSYCLSDNTLFEVFLEYHAIHSLLDGDTVFLFPENPIDHRALHNRSPGRFGGSWWSSNIFQK